MQDDRQPSDSHEPRAGEFATTHWSLVLAAGERANVESTRALDQLCRAYWPPLYAYVRRRVRDVHEAQDLTQAFFERGEALSCPGRSGARPLSRWSLFQGQAKQSATD